MKKTFAFVMVLCMVCALLSVCAYADNQKFIIPREVLIENSFSIQLTHNPRLNKAINYAFLID